MLGTGTNASYTASVYGQIIKCRHSFKNMLILNIKDIKPKKEKNMSVIYEVCKFQARVIELTQIHKPRWGLPQQHPGQVKNSLFQ